VPSLVESSNPLFASSSTNKWILIFSALLQGEQWVKNMSGAAEEEAAEPEMDIEGRPPRLVSPLCYSPGNVHQLHRPPPSPPPSPPTTPKESAYQPAFITYFEGKF